MAAPLFMQVHGSGLGVGHFWMQTGTAIVEVVPSGWWYCHFSYCGAVSGKVWALSSAAGASRAGRPAALRSNTRLRALTVSPDHSHMQSGLTPNVSARRR
eukprot:561603-Prymnesium_polylepis.1